MEVSEVGAYQDCGGQDNWALWKEQMCFSLKDCCHVGNVAKSLAFSREFENLDF